MMANLLIKWTRSPAAPMLAALLLAGAALAEEKSVKRAELTVREGKGSIYKPVATLRRGDVVNVVGRDETNSRWLKVSVGGKTGWVYEDALETRAVASSAGGVGFINAGATAAPNAAAASGNFEDRISVTGGVTLAGGGWDAKTYAQANKLNPAGLQAMMGSRQALTPQQIEAFMSQGKVGAGQ